MSSVSSSSSSSCHLFAAGREIVGLSGGNEAISSVLPTPTYVPKQENFFGEDDWNKFCGKVPPAPPLPLIVKKIWEGICPIFPGPNKDQRVCDTHFIMYLPKTVNGKPLTLNTFGEIAKCYFTVTGYRFYWPEIKEKMGDQPVEKDGWLIVTKEPIEKSKGASYETQKNMIQKLAENTGIPYTVPKAQQVVFGVLTHFMLTKCTKRTPTRLLGDNPWTYTRCQENINRRQLAVGGFSSASLSIFNDSIGNEDNTVIGVVASAFFPSSTSESSTTALTTTALATTTTLSARLWRLLND